MPQKVIPISTQRGVAPRYDGAPLADTLGRGLRDLRISVTDRCNFRCYCMPREVFDSHFRFLPREEVLRFEEIARLAQIFVGLGVKKTRLTGGEPLVRRDLGAGLHEQPRRDPAKLAQPLPMPSEDRAQEPRHGEDVLPVRHGLEHVLLDPLAVQEHPLLVAARAEVTRLAGVGEQVVVPAGVAVDAGEAVVRVAALDEALDRPLLDCAAQPAREGAHPAFHVGDLLPAGERRLHHQGEKAGDKREQADHYDGPRLVAQRVAQAAAGGAHIAGMKFPQVDHPDASGELKAIYDDIQATLRAPWVAFACRVLATFPAFLPLAWRTARSHFTARHAERAADAIRARAVLPGARPPGPRAKLERLGWDQQKVGELLQAMDAYNYGNPKYLLLITAWAEAIQGRHPSGKALAPEEAEPVPYASAAARKCSPSSTARRPPSSRT